MAFEVFKMMGTIALNKEDALRDIQIIKQSAIKSTKEMGGAFAKFTKDHSAQFKKIGMVSAAAGAVIGLAIKKVRGSFDEYESALIDMGKVTDESFGSIENRMKKIPPVLGSLTELTRGYYQIVSAGVKEPTRAINTLTVSAQTAAAAHMNQSEVVKGLTKVMAGYEGKIKDVSEAADLMFAIEKEGQTNVGELIPIIGGLATMSSKLKISQDEMGASMAVITKTAGSTAEASTELEGVLTGLMKPTEAMKAVIHGMGFETAETAIEELGFVEVLRKVEEATGGSSEKLGELFGRKQAILGISKLTAEGMTVLSDTINSVAQKAGTANEAYKKWLTTGEALNKETKAVTENLLTLIGKAIDPMMDVLQRRMVDVVTVAGQWIEKNNELAASIAQWSGGIGIALVPFGALMLMLPGLVIALPKISLAVTAISNSFAAWATSLGVTMPELALIIATIGLVTKATYGWIDAIKESKRIKEMEAESAKSTAAGLDKLREAYEMTDEEIQYWIENHKLSASVLERVAQKERDLAKIEYELASAKAGTTEATKNQIKSLEELDAAALNSLIKGKELSEQQEGYIALRQRMSDIDRTATQRKLDDLDRESTALLANMDTNLMTMEQIDEYRNVMRSHIIAESAEREEYTRNMQEVENKLFELEHSRVEVRIRDLEKERDARIENAKQAHLSAEDLATAIETFNKAYDKEKASILELAVARSEKEIASINKSIERRKKAGEAIDELIKKRNEEIANLKGLKEGYEKTAEGARKLAAAEAKKKVYKVVNAEGETIGIRSQQQLSQEEVAAGVTLVPMAQGGLVQTLFNAVRYLASGGGIGTDTVPIMATPGEYIIKKQMVDFIRKTGMVTGGLVKAIQKGLPTPNPEFAEGGMVDRWSGAQPERLGTTIDRGIWGGSISVVINAKTLDDATIDQAGDKILEVVHRKAKNAGWVFGRS